MPEPIDTSTLGPIKIGGPPKPLTLSSNKVAELEDLLADNISAWLDEEDSVQQEHADLIERLRNFELRP